MTHKLNLMLHCGTDAVDREVVLESPTPPPTGYRGGFHTHYPLPHGHVLERVERHLAHAGMTIVEEAHGLTHDGARYFGMLQVANGQQSDDYGMVVGIRNSHDKRFPASLVMGSGVFVCDNLAFSGEVKLSRKHTRHIIRDLSQLISRAVSRLVDVRQRQDVRIAAYKEHDVSDREAHDTIIRALDCKVVPSSKIEQVVAEWRKPSHPEFNPRTAWSLFNSFTEILKGNAQYALRRTQALHGLLDTVCGIAV